jgi:DNA-binding transcriptional MerR regulator
MTIKEVCTQFEITADTLRYYERVGAIPEVGRTAGGIRNYTEEDLKLLCIRRKAPVEVSGGGYRMQSAFVEQEFR